MNQVSQFRGNGAIFSPLNPPIGSAAAVRQRRLPAPLTTKGFFSLWGG